MQDTMPGTSPMDANADGKARAPAPITVLVRLTTDDVTVACPLCILGMGRTRSGVDGPDGVVEPYDMVESVEDRRGEGGVISRMGPGAGDVGVGSGERA